MSQHVELRRSTSGMTVIAQLEQNTHRERSRAGQLTPKTHTNKARHHWLAWDAAGQDSHVDDRIAHPGGAFQARGGLVRRTRKLMLLGGF
jgi:hypothetical protein